MALDLTMLIFQELLKISPELLARYPSVQDKLLYLFLIPHVVLFMFLWSFGDWIIRSHAKIRNALVITAYIYLLWSGFYGSIFVPIVNAWFMLTIMTAFIFFILSRTFSPLRLPALTGLAVEVGRKLREPRDMEEKLQAINNILIGSGLNDVAARELRANPYRRISQNDFTRGARRNKDLMTALLPLLVEREEIIRKLRGRY